MIPEIKPLLSQLDLNLPLIGVYDAPAEEMFSPVLEPVRGRHVCIFAYFKQWLKGKTVKISKNNYGCGGCGRSMFNIKTRQRDDFLSFLAEEEGLKKTKDLMGRWLENDTPYQPVNSSLFFGPFREEAFEFLKSVTFLVNPDQLSVLMIGAHYNHAPDDPHPPVLAPFGSGCMQLLPLFKDINYPQAILGSTDIAMRQYLPPNILTFSVTVPMLLQLCDLDEQSFLFKPFMQNLKKARPGNKL